MDTDDTDDTDLGRLGREACFGAAGSISGAGRAAAAAGSISGAGRAAAAAAKRPIANSRRVALPGRKICVVRVHLCPSAMSRFDLICERR